MKELLKFAIFVQIIFLIVVVAASMFVHFDIISVLVSSVIIFVAVLLAPIISKALDLWMK
jgi:hypothetical protein